METRPHDPVPEVMLLGSHRYVSLAAFWQERQVKEALRQAIIDHHQQRADDRCIEDDDRLYAAAGLPPCDRRVGSKVEMLANCARFIERRCEGGHWPTYAQLDTALRAILDLTARERGPASAVLEEIARLAEEAIRPSSDG